MMASTTMAWRAGHITMDELIALEVLHDYLNRRRPKDIRMWLSWADDLLEPDVSAWAFTQTVREVACPRCNALAGQSCCEPKGRKTQPHLKRLRAYREKIGIAEFVRRHRRC